MIVLIIFLFELLTLFCFGFAYNVFRRFLATHSGRDLSAVIVLVMVGLVFGSAFFGLITTLKF